MFESMAVGQPIVASLNGEAARLVTAAGCGLIAEPGNPEALEAAVRTLAGNPEMRSAMGRSGREYVVENFNRARIAVRLRRLLVDCVEPAR